MFLLCAADIPEEEARYWAKKLEQLNAMRDQDVRNSFLATFPSLSWRHLFIPSSLKYFLSQPFSFSSFVIARTLCNQWQQSCQSQYFLPAIYHRGSEFSEMSVVVVFFLSMPIKRNRSDHYMRHPHSAVSVTSLLCVHLLLYCLLCVSFLCLLFFLSPLPLLHCSDLLRTGLDRRLKWGW